MMKLLLALVVLVLASSLISAEPTNDGTVQVLREIPADFGVNGVLSDHEFDEFGFLDSTSSTAAPAATAAPAKAGKTATPAAGKTAGKNANKSAGKQTTAGKAASVKAAPVKAAKPKAAPKSAAAKNQNKPKKADTSKLRPLMPNWKATKDPASGQNYYYNTITRITTWDRPEQSEEYMEMQRNATNSLQSFYKSKKSLPDLEILPPELRFPLTALPPINKCMKPTRIRVKQEPYNQRKSISRKFLRAILGKPKSLVKNRVKVRDVSFSCVDGRKQGPVLGTPGGDFGEFLVALSVAEELSGSHIKQAHVTRLLKAWLHWPKKGKYSMFHNTDERAIAHLQKHLHVNGQTGVVTDLNMQSPPVQLRSEILKLLGEAENQGSTFIKAVLSYPHKFRIRPRLTASLIRAYYSILWDDQAVCMYDGKKLNSKLNLEIYSGKSKERAWLSFRANNRCENDFQTYTFSPKGPVTKRFIDDKKKPSAASNASANAKNSTSSSSSLPRFAQSNGASDIGIGGNVVDFPTNIQLDIRDDVASPAAPASPSLLESNTAADSSADADADADKPSSYRPATKQPHPAAPAPLTIDDSKQAVQAFVHHPHAVGVPRKWLSRFFALRFPDAASQPKFLQELNRRQELVVENAAEIMGKDVAFYTITVE